LAALFVKVMARICLKLLGSANINRRYSFTSVKVFPEPADDLYTVKDKLFFVVRYNFGLKPGLFMVSFAPSLKANS
jgi:hypothetical protein